MVQIPHNTRTLKPEKNPLLLLEVTDFFVPLQREGWVNLQRPALIPAKLNAWLFYLYDAFAVNAIDKVKQFIL